MVACVGRLGPLIRIFALTLRSGLELCVRWSQSALSRMGLEVNGEVIPSYHERRGTYVDKVVRKRLTPIRLGNTRCTLTCVFVRLGCAR